MTDKYASSGVNYDILDPFKVAAQKAAEETRKNIEYLGLEELPASRGESVFLVKSPEGYIAHVEETLGTKNLVADEMEKITGRSFYDSIAQDTVAAIVNDLITSGALPVSIAMHLAVGDSSWFENQERAQSLISGWKKACDLSHAVWAGGETPSLEGIVNTHTVLLSGSAVGIIKNEGQRIRGDLQDGDRIILLKSSGIHTNGLSLARSIADKLPEGYETKLSDERMFGEALLDPSHIYVPVMRRCIEQGIPLHYASNITGHGWRKIMRAPLPLHYVIEHVPEPHPVFVFIQKQTGMSDEEMYATFNMGAGFALYVAPHHAPEVLNICNQLNMGVFNAGFVAKEGKTKKVSLQEKGIIYGGESLRVR